MARSVSGLTLGGWSLKLSPSVIKHGQWTFIPLQLLTLNIDDEDADISMLMPILAGR